MHFLSHSDISFKGLHVLLRVDWNVPTDKDMILENTRLLTTRETISFLKNKGAKVIILSHLGRPTLAKEAFTKEKETSTGASSDSQPTENAPNYVYEENYAFKPLMQQIRTILKMPLFYIDNPFSYDGQKMLQNMDDGDVVICENIRFFSGEEENTVNFSQKLASLAQIYVNDAFACAHRAHASTEGVAHFLPSYAGFSLEHELFMLNQACTQAKRPLWAVIGGAKVSSKIDVLLNLSKKVDGMIIGGAMANTFLKAKGISVGKSLVEDEHVSTALQILTAASCEIILPIDGMAAQNLDETSINFDYTHIPDDYAVYDIGPLTVELFKTKLENARTVIWNGPLGVFEKTAYSTGTTALAKAMANLTTLSGVITVAGGGDTLAAVELAKVGEKLSLISTGGGAFLEWLEGKSLPGVDVLKKKA